MTTYAIGATSLTGGGLGALDAEYVNENGTSPWSGDGETPGIHNGDPAFVTVQGDKVYHYIANATSGAAESSPDVIKPDEASDGVAYTGDLRWILHKTYGVDQEFTSAEKSKLSGIESSADVTDTTNVTAAGAVMDSEVDADIKTLSLPASTTISAFGATLVDDADAETARATVGLDNVENTTHSTDAHTMSIDGRDISVDGTKLDGIEAGADVTDTANVTAAGALMDSEVDADIKTLSLPASTTISSFGKTLVDDADAATARSTLGLGSASTRDAEDTLTDGANLPDGAAIKAYGDANWAGGGVDTSGTPIANDIARFTDADTIEGRSYAELKADLNLEIGTDVLAEQTIGIADDNLVEMDDADAADNDYARFTTNGLEGRSYAEVKNDLNLDNVENTAHSTDAHTMTIDGRDVSVDGTKLDGIEASADVTDATNVGSTIHGASAKTTPVDADTAPLIDSAASNVLKKLTWANVKATLKTYFDALYNLYTHPNHSGDVTSVADGAQTIANDAVTYAKMQNVVDDERILGRVSGANGVVEELTKTQALTMLNVEDGAEANNISDSNATDLTDSGDSALHYHASDRNRANHTGTQTASTVSDFDTEVSNNTDVAANTTHKSSNGSDHTYIDQDVTSGSSPTLDGANFSGIDHGGLEGLSDDDHPQYVKDSEFTQDSGVLVGTGVATFSEETGTTLQASLGIYAGAGTFAGTSGDTISIGSTLAGTSYSVQVTPTGDSLDVGAIYVTDKTTTTFKVCCTGAGTPTFDYQLIDLN